MIEDEIREHVRQIATREHAAIEEACEKALQLGDRGVLIIRESNLDLEGLTATSTMRVGPSLLVPYGRIWECPSLEAAIVATTRTDRPIPAQGELT